MKKITNLLLCLSMMFMSFSSISPVKAEMITGTIDNGNVTWEIDTETGICKISGNGALVDFRVSDYSESVKELIIESGITSINEYAGYGFPNIEKISIPDTVESIEIYAFPQKNSLTTITVDSNNPKYASNDCNAIIDQTTNTMIIGCSTTTIPESVTTIGSYAFWACDTLSDIVIPDTVTSIENNAFAYCRGLEHITLPSTITEIKQGVFLGCGLKEITIPDTVTSIKDEAFYNNPFTSITIPNSVTSIGALAFSVSGLTEVVIPDSVTSIGSSAFSYCYDMESVTLPNQLTTIENGAFEFSPSLTSITIPESVTTIERDAFFRSGLKEIVIPDSVTSIGPNAFFGCKNLESVTLPKNITTISASMFKDASSLTSINIPRKVTTIEKEAFAGTALEETIVPETVTSIASDAFPYGTVIYGIEGSYVEEYVKQSNGKYSFVPFNYPVDEIFDDVEKDAWYHGYIQYAYDNGLMTGYTGSNLFGIGDEVTREQMVQVLYNMAGQPAVEEYKATEIFNDLYEGAWFEDAINWAYNNGITQGMKEDYFGVGVTIDRQQMVTFFIKYANFSHKDTQTKAVITGYPDYDQVADWAVDNIRWAVAYHLISGVEDSDGTAYLDPNDSATREQLATVLNRYKVVFEM